MHFFFSNHSHTLSLLRTFGAYQRRKPAETTQFQDFVEREVLISSLPVVLGN